MKPKHVMMALAAPMMALAAVPADAAVFTFTLTGAYTAAFDIDDSEFDTPGLPDEPDNRYFEVNSTDGEIIAFNTLAFNGGLTLGEDFDNLWGEQLFTGSVETPTLRTGTFSLLLGGEASRIATLVIAPQAEAPIPEPMTWAMMVLGFGTAGAAMRRRRVTFATA